MHKRGETLLLTLYVPSPAYTRRSFCHVGGSGISNPDGKSMFTFQGQSLPELHAMPFLVTTFTIGWRLITL